jgi:hypothetical protein
MKVNEYLPNLDVEVPVWFDALERFYRPWNMAYFWPFSNVISIKTSCATQKKYLQYGGDRRNVIDDVTCKSSIESDWLCLCALCFCLCWSIPSWAVEVWNYLKMWQGKLLLIRRQKDLKLPVEGVGLAWTCGQVASNKTWCFLTWKQRTVSWGFMLAPTVGREERVWSPFQF